MSDDERIIGGNDPARVVVLLHPDTHTRHNPLTDRTPESIALRLRVNEGLPCVEKGLKPEASVADLDIQREVLARQAVPIQRMLPTARSPTL